jgi:hypothetical protein
MTLLSQDLTGFGDATKPGRPVSPSHPSETPVCSLVCQGRFVHGAERAPDRPQIGIPGGGIDIEYQRLTSSEIRPERL